MIYALVLQVGTTVGTSVVLIRMVRRVWVVVDGLSAMASHLAAQSQVTTAHAALLSGSVDTLRRDLLAVDYLEQRPEVR